MAVLRLTLLSLFLGLAELLCAQKASPDTTSHRMDAVLITAPSTSAADLLVDRSLVRGSAPSAAEALSQLPGLYIVQPNTFPLSYRGLSGNRMRIEQNGMRRTGINRQGFLAEDINPEEIASLRMVSGIDKVLFGSGAMGGVLRIEEWDGSAPAYSSAYSAYGTNNQSRQFGFTVGHSGSKTDMMLSGRTSREENYRSHNSTEVRNSETVQNKLSATIRLNGPREDHQILLRQQISNGDWERPQGFQNNPLEFRNFRNRYTYKADLEHKKKYARATWKQHANLLLLATDQEIENYSLGFSSLQLRRLRANTKQAAGYRGTLLLPRKTNRELTVGIDLYASELTETYTEQSFLDGRRAASPQENIRQEVMGGLFGRFLQRHRYSQWIVAARLDGAFLGDSGSLKPFQAVTGGVEYRWKQHSVFLNSISLGRYFRYPTQLEATGIFFGGRGAFYGNPEINPEVSYQLDWTVMGERNAIGYQLSTWVALFTNRITEVPRDAESFTYTNSARARTLGFDWLFSYRLTPADAPTKFQVIGSGTVMRGDELTRRGFLEEGDPLLGVPAPRTRAAIRMKLPVSRAVDLRAEIQGDYHAQFNRIPEGFISQTWAVDPAASYVLLNSTVDVTFQAGSQTIKAGLRSHNLTDAEFYPFGSRVAGMGRNFRFSLRVEL